MTSWYWNLVCFSLVPIRVCNTILKSKSMLLGVSCNIEKKTVKDWWYIFYFYTLNKH